MHRSGASAEEVLRGVHDDVERDRAVARRQRYATHEHDRSARALRDGIAAALGVAPAIVISDSFGRPWRLGIVDVALGVAGFAPLADLRGTPDADGRTMNATIVAVADEIASAAELASGKTSRRPVVLVRGAPLPPGDGSVAVDVVMDPAQDLFR